MFCSNCGQQIEEGSIFCGNCGNRITMTTQNVNVVNVSKRNSKLIRIIAVCVILVIGFIIGIILWQNKGTQKKDSTFDSYVIQSRESCDIKNIDEIRTAIGQYASEDPNYREINLIVDSDGYLVTGIDEAGNKEDITEIIKNYNPYYFSGDIADLKLISNTWDKDIEWNYDVQSTTWTENGAAGTFYYGNGMRK